MGRSTWARTTVGHTSSFSWAESRPESWTHDGRDPTDESIGSQRSIEKIEPTRIELTYSNVKLNAPIRVEEFAFAAARHGQRRRTTPRPSQHTRSSHPDGSRRKKAESAKKDEPLLDKSIEIPATPPQTTPPPQ